MRHRKRTYKVGRNCGHRRCLSANLLKSFIENEKIETTVTKGKELKRQAEKMITLGKKNTLAARREAKARLMVSYNPLTTKEKRAAKEGKKESYNIDRRVIGKLFDVLAPRYASRAGGYTRLVRSRRRLGDNAELCWLEWVTD